MRDDSHANNPMIGALLLTLLLVPVAAQSQQGRVRVEVRERLIVRMPAPAPIRWKEKRGPKCVAIGLIAGQAIVKADSIDLILRGGARMRARFASRCPALDFYSGFYVRPTPDGRICADRDAVYARSGGQCQIERFRTLLPDPER